MSVAGIDFSSRFVDVVLLDETTDAATWHRVALSGADAFDRARSVRSAMFRDFPPSLWDDVLAVGIEDPRGYGAGSLYRVQGAILACIAAHKLVQPWIPSAWRKAVGLPGNCDKAAVTCFVGDTLGSPAPGLIADEAFYWPQDACDAYCIALATRQQIQQVAA